MRGPLEGEILDIAATDATELYGAEPPTWVAGILIEGRPGKWDLGLLCDRPRTAFQPSPLDFRAPLLRGTQLPCSAMLQIDPAVKLVTCPVEVQDGKVHAKIPTVVMD